MVGKSILEKRPCLIPAGGASTMLFLALAPWPYGYYQLLRFVVCGVSAYVAFMAYTGQKTWATYLFGLFAVLFNPLIPIHLSRELWRPIDVICATLLIFSVVALKNPAEKERQ
jgi:uncharacterized membrane protein YccC